MPPTTPALGSVRSSAAVNAEIRALVRAAHGRLYGADRVRYAELVEEWAEAVRAEVVEAA
ncbi:hypothetical protein CVT30_21610 [Streptomyces sp. AMCC400023]|nr:hypothetical protein [Streptomyces sp. AMCC400023]UJV42100.1 hypothetical protein CVT30_21610 [Streptomyces sp. AMCC400023]